MVALKYINYLLTYLLTYLHITHVLTCRWNASGGCKTSEFVEVSDHIVVHNDSGQQVTSWHSLTAIAVHSFSIYSNVRAFFCNKFFCVLVCVCMCVVDYKFVFFLKRASVTQRRAG